MAMLGKYILLLFSIAIVGYLMGYPSLMLENMFDFAGGSAPAGKNLLANIYALFTSVSFLALLGIAAITTFLTGGGNFSSFFVIPLTIIIAVFANLMIVPSAVFFDASIPLIIRMMIGGFMNILVTLAIVDFIRGGSVM